jgi:hypothetical protein
LPFSEKNIYEFFGINILKLFVSNFAKNLHLLEHWPFKDVGINEKK